MAHVCSWSCSRGIGCLAELAAGTQEADAPEQGLSLPRPSEAGWPVVRNCLVSVRSLPDRLLSRCHQLGLVFADHRRNALFQCTDAQRNPTGAEIVGTLVRPDGSRYRGMARGSRKDRGGFWLPVDRSRPVAAIIVESAIDALSAWLLHPRLRTSGTVFVSTSGTTHRIPEWLGCWSLERILCAFDADQSGDSCASCLMQDNLSAVWSLRPVGANDWNDEPGK